MSYRRRRGLGGGGRSWLERLRAWLPGPGGGREEAREETPGGDASGDAGDGAGKPSGPPRERWRRYSIVALLLVLLFGAGYLLSARWLFPDSGQPDEGNLVEVPELVGLTVEEARRTLDDAGLALRRRSRVPHRDAPEDAVLAQNPLPGQYSRPGAPVAVTLSLGPERRGVPDLRGLSGRQGRIVLERLGFEADVDTTASPVERGRVVGTRPEAGTVRTLPGRVTVVVSEGPRVADVPELTGLHVDDVKDRLESAGLALGDVQYDPEARAAPGRVVGQSPPGGYALRAGGRVSVRVAGAAPDPPSADSVEGGSGDFDREGTDEPSGEPGGR